MAAPSSAASPSRFTTWWLPAIIAQSMIVGGGYATGRETVEYAARYGPRGWFSVGIIFVGFALCCGLAFEVARQAKTYDYKSWIRQLIGPLWPLFDLLLVSLTLLVLSVMSAAIGSIVEQTTGVPATVALVAALVVVGWVAWSGSEFLEKFKTYGSLVLYGGYALFSYRVLTAPIGPAEDSVAELDASWLDVVLSAAQYVGYNATVIAPVLFCLHRQTRRSESLISGTLAGVLMTLPFALTLACLLRFGGRSSVLESEVPWLVMLELAAGDEGSRGLWLALFGFVAGWTLLETAIGSIHALIDRIEANLTDLPSVLRPRSGSITRGARAVLSIGVLILTGLLARFGVIDLVARGYGTLAWGFLALLVGPLLIVGTYRLFRPVSR